VLPAILMCALSAGSPELEVPEPPPPPVTPTWHFAALPLVSYGSDVGLTLGGALFLYRPLAEHPSEHDTASLSLSYATRGPRSIDASSGFMRVFGTSLRTFLNVHVGDDDQMPYWGEGAQLGGLLIPSGYGSPPEPYRYHDRRLFLTGILRGAIAGPLGWHLRARWIDVDVAEPSALLASSRPPGFRGGRVALGEVGLLYDSRDREVNTRSGVFVSAAVFAAPQLAGVSDFAFHGYDGAIRVYVPLGLGITLAARALYDRKLAGIPERGDPLPAVPFFERSLYEGISYNEGLGGAATIRGIARYRVAGDEKMLANVELRATLLTTHLASKMQEWGVDVGVDAGRAQQPGYPPIDGAGAVVGLRLIWDRAVLLRVEMGRARGGDNTLYISFGEQF
jgi:hypothetical protein